MEAYFEERISVDYSIFNHNDTVISVSLFTCANSYNKYTVYLNGLKTLINTFMRYNNKIKFLIFYDVDNDDLELLVKENPCVTLCKFNFPEFKYDEHHLGMFGTLMRYLPMFLTKFQYKYLYIIDCDVVNERIPNYKLFTFKNFIKTNTNLHILTIPSAPLNPRYSGMEINLNTWIRIIGESIILREIKFPVEIIYNFLHIYINSDAYVTQMNIIFTENIKYETKLKPNHGKFMYGVDEFMLVFLMQYIEENNIPYRYTLCPYYYKLPFYYWLENEATDEMKLKLKVALDGKDLMDFVTSYKYRDRSLMFKTLLSKININEYFSPVICDCIKRESKYLDYTYSLSSN